MLLRRVIDQYAEKLEGEVITNIRSRLVDSWAKEDSPAILKRLNHIMAQSAARGDWNEFLPFILTSCVKMNTLKIVSALEMVEILAEYSPDQIFANISVLGNFLGGLISSAEGKISIACARATAACIVSIDDEVARNSFKPAVEPIIHVLGNSLSQGQESDATSIMEHLVSIAQIQPLFFRGALDSLVLAMLTIANNSDLEFSTRSIAIELVVTFSETAPALARRCTALTEGLIPCALKIMLEVDTDDKEWLALKYSEESLDENYMVGEEAIERVAAGLGGKVVIPMVMPLAQAFATNVQWNYRRAAVSAITRLAEGCSKQFQTYIPTCCDFLLVSLQDTSFRVQFEAEQAIGQLAALFPESLDQFINKFMGALVSLLSAPSSCERVRGHAASAMINLCSPEHVDADVLQPYIESILNAIVACLQGASLDVQSPCLVLLGCVAQVSEKAFIPYYGSLMPGIKSILGSNATDMSPLLRGKAMECAGLLIEAVGIETSSTDALQILHFLLHFIEADPEGSFEFALPACARISKVLKTDIVPFLPTIMTAVLRGATQEIHFSMEDVLDGEEEDEDVENDGENKTQSAIVSLGNGIKKRVTLNTHAVQQKNQASRLIFEFADAVKGHLNAYLLPTVQALIPNLTDKHSADIRSSSSLALAKVFDAYVDAAKLGCPNIFGPFGSLHGVFTACMTKLQECLKGENNGASRVCAAESIRDILQSCYLSGVEELDGSRSSIQCGPDLNLATKCIKDLMERCKESLGRRQQIESAVQQNEGLDAEDMEGSEELEEEEELLSALVDGLGHFLKVNGESLMAVFDATVAPAFSPLLAPNQPTSLQILGICILDDVIEFGGRAALKYVPNMLSLFTSCLSTSGHSVVRQSSAYGIAQCARKATEIFAQHLSTVVPLLMSSLGVIDAKDEDNFGTIENIVFALAIIYNTPVYRSFDWGVAPAAVAAEWIQHLPLRADEVEAKVTHHQFCECIEKLDAHILGEGQTNLNVVLRVVADIFVATEESGEDSYPLMFAVTQSRLANVLRQISTAMPPNAFQSCMQCLSAEQQAAMARIAASF